MTDLDDAPGPATADTPFDVRTHNGRVTIENPATGGHRTFRIRTQPADAKFAPGKRVVSLLTGPDNGHDYTGFAFADEGGVHVWAKYRAREFEADTVYQTYARMLADPERWKARGCVYLFEGRCRVCNRALTDPESIRSGIGPVCAGRS